MQTLLALTNLPRCIHLPSGHTHTALVRHCIFLMYLFVISSKFSANCLLFFMLMAYVLRVLCFRKSCEWVQGSKWTVDSDWAPVSAVATGMFKQVISAWLSMMEREVNALCFNVDKCCQLC